MQPIPNIKISGNKTITNALTQGLRKAATETRVVTLEQGTQWNMIEY